MASSGYSGQQAVICLLVPASPAILQRSGVGEASLLKSQGIDVIADRKVSGQSAGPSGGIFPDRLHSTDHAVQASSGLKSRYWRRWLLFKSGLGRLTSLKHWLYSFRQAIPYPDIQYHFLPVAIR